MKKISDKNIIKVQSIAALVALALVAIALFTPWVHVTLDPLSPMTLEKFGTYVGVAYLENADSLDSKEMEKLDEILENIADAQEVVADKAKGYEVNISPFKFLMGSVNTVRAFSNVIKVTAADYEALENEKFSEFSPQTVEDLYIVMSISNAFDISLEGDAFAESIFILFNALINIIFFVSVIIGVLVYAIKAIIVLIKSLTKIKSIDEDYAKNKKYLADIYNVFSMLLFFMVFFPRSHLTFGGVLMLVSVIAITAINIAAIYIKPFNANQKKYAMISQIAIVLSSIFIVVLSKIAAASEAVRYISSSEAMAQMIAGGVDLDTALIVPGIVKLLFRLFTLIMPVSYIAYNMLRGTYVKENDKVNEAKAAYGPIVLGVILSAAPLVVKYMFKVEYPETCSAGITGVCAVTIILLVIEIARKIVIKKLTNITPEEREDLFKALPAASTKAEQASEPVAEQTSEHAAEQTSENKNNA